LDSNVTISIDLGAPNAFNRRCGECTLCCKLIPVAELRKPANKKCKHQRFGVGCTIYEDRPHSCRYWSCGWLADPTTAGLSRPDRAHYCIDIVPDYVRFIPTGGGEVVPVPVVQVWCDPSFPHAHEDPALRSYLAGVAERHGMAALIRFSERDAFTLFAPALTGGGWETLRGACEGQHSFADINRVFNKLVEHGGHNKRIEQRNGRENHDSPQGDNAVLHDDDRDVSSRATAE